MSADLLYRVAITLLLIGAGVAAYWAWNRMQLRRLARTSVVNAPGLEALRPGTAAVLYFTTDECTVCRTAQKPALEQLRVRLGEAVQVIEVNAAERPGVADHWGVLSVPTTFIIDPHGQPRRVNHGLTGREKLAAQLAEFLPAQPHSEAASRLAVK